MSRSGLASWLKNSAICPTKYTKKEKIEATIQEKTVEAATAMPISTVSSKKVRMTALTTLPVMNSIDIAPSPVMVAELRGLDARRR